MTTRNVPTRFLAGLLVLAVTPWVSACGGSDGGTAPDRSNVAFLEIDPGAVLVTELGASINVRAVPLDSRGDVATSQETVEWRIEDESVARFETGPNRVVGVAVGETRLVATLGSLTAEVAVEVYLDPNTGPFEAGEVYFGRNDYVEYEVGELPVILSAPHGGVVRPSEIPERTFGVTARDRQTQPLTRVLADEIERRSGKRPHVIISRLDRDRLDPNREIVEAAQGSPFAEQAWREFHGFIQEASADVEAQFTTGLYLDIHGHGHPIDRLELGYLLSSADLRVSDAELADDGRLEKSSLRTLAGSVPISFAELVRGPISLGGLMQARGYRSVPSPADPNPGTDPFFSGGYNTREYGSRDGGGVSGIQIEHHFDGVRDTAENRQAYVEKLAEALEVFLMTHYGYDWTAGN